MSSVAVAPHHLAVDAIDVGENVRELDQAHVKTLAASIALRGLIVPLVVRPNGDRFTLVAGHHRLAACQSLGLQQVEVTIREHDGSSADAAAENVVRKQLSPLEEARAVKHMLDEGYTLDGAATVLGWNRKLVGARAKILELPDTAQQLIGTGELPVSAVSMIAKIAEVSRELCEVVLAPVSSGEISGEQFASNPSWAIGHALRANPTAVFAAHLSALRASEIDELRLGKKADEALAMADELHRKVDRYAYGPPPIRFADAEVDQARAAGVLIEFDEGTPIITDRSLFRELTKQAIQRTVQDLKASADSHAAERTSGAGAGRARTPEERLLSEHRATVRALTARAHGTNLDLGSELLQKLASVDPADMDVARFFAYGLLGPDATGFLGAGEGTAATLAANGVRLVFEQHRTTSTATLKDGKPGRTKVEYGEPDEAAAWMWKFLDGARNAGELYGRALVLFAAQGYAVDLVLPTAKRRPSALPASHKDTARKAFERLVKPLLPQTHVQLRRALEREARAYAKRVEDVNARPAASGKDVPETASENTES